MTAHSPLTRALAPVAALAAGALALTACSAGDLAGGDDNGGKTTITFLVDTSDASKSYGDGLAKAFNASQDKYVVEVETRPEGAEGDNLVKTRLSTGDMAEVFLYNTGSLLQALDPAKNLAPVPERERRRRERHVPGDGEDRAMTTTASPSAPRRAAECFTTRRSSASVGLEVPKTWDEFMANNAKIKAAGIDPVIQTYGDTWTSQLFVLGDYHNVAVADPDWADKYTANEVHYADEPGVEGFKHQQEVHDAGYMNKDFASATLEQGLEKLATGEGAQYPMLTFALGGLYSAFPDAARTSASTASRVTTPPRPARRCGPAVASTCPRRWTATKLEAAQGFQEFIASTEGCDAQTAAYDPAGPYFVDGCELPADVRPPCRTWSPTPTRKVPAHRRSSSSRRSRGPPWSRSPWRWDRASGPARTAPSSTTRTSRSRPNSSASPAGTDTVPGRRAIDPPARPDRVDQ